MLERPGTRQSLSYVQKKGQKASTERWQTLSSGTDTAELDLLNVPNKGCGYALVATPLRLRGCLLQSPLLSVNLLGLCVVFF